MSKQTYTLAIEVTTTLPGSIEPAPGWGVNYTVEVPRHYGDTATRRFIRTKVTGIEKCLFDMATAKGRWLPDGGFHGERFAFKVQGKNIVVLAYYI